MIEAWAVVLNGEIILERAGEALAIYFSKDSAKELKQEMQKRFPYPEMKYKVMRIKISIKE